MARKKLKEMDVTKKATGFVAEFRKFIARGNVLDMAVGVIIGGAFGSISASLVNDVIMPVISLMTGGINFDDWKIVLREAVVEEGETVQEAVTLSYGNFLATVLNFLIVALAVFLLIKVINNAAALALRKKEEEKKEDPAPTKEELLLTEIRDLLKEANGTPKDASGAPAADTPAASSTPSRNGGGKSGRKKR